MSGEAATLPMPEESVAVYEYVPGTEAQAAHLLDVLSLFAPDEEDARDGDAES